MSDEKKVGLGIGPTSGGPLSGDIYDLMAKSPKLALAKAIGAPFAPFIVQCLGTFSSTAAQTLAPVQGDVQLTQDTVVDQLIFRTQPKTTPSGTFDALNFFFQNYELGIQATLAVTGRPSYMIAPNFTYISALGDIIGGSHWPGGLVIRAFQSFSVQYNAVIALPTAPLDVVAVFRCYQPISETFTQMTDQEAFAGLQGLGYDTTFARQVIVGR